MLIMENRLKYRLILKAFIAFLKKNNVYNEYLSSLEDGYDYRLEHKKATNEKQYIINTVTTKPYRLILDAFKWSDYSQVKWSDLSDEWEYEVWKMEKVFSLK